MHDQTHVYMELEFIGVCVRVYPLGQQIIVNYPVFIYVYERVHLYTLVCAQMYARL